MLNCAIYRQGKVGGGLDLVARPQLFGYAVKKTGDKPDEASITSSIIGKGNFCGQWLLQ